MNHGQGFRVAAALSLIPLSLGCEAPEVSEAPPTPASEAGAPARPEPAGTAPLTEIMQALAVDMAAAAYGIWIENADSVSAAARRIADHPRVTAEEAAAIQATLGEEFSAFVAFDQRVHDLAVQLGDAADQGGSITELLDSHIRIQTGCVGCHEQFRERVRSARQAR